MRTQMTPFFLILLIQTLLGSLSVAASTSDDLESELNTAWVGQSNIRPSTASNSLATGLDVTEGNLEYVVCMTGNRLNVRTQSLSQVLFTVAPYAQVLPVQSFGTDRLQKVINGITYTFMKAQFPERNSDLNTGWVAEDFVRLKSECPGAITESSTGLASSKRIFPTVNRPIESYRTGARRFGSPRDNGSRLHAASDLYATHGENVLSIYSGKVIRTLYYFYQGTYALEVKHSDGKVVRYGEITGKSAPNTSKNDSVSAGQVIGYVGTVNSGCCHPMLHFEMYAGTQTGNLLTSGNIYNRRSDLLDPTEYLAKWEKEKFGTSY
ncbi:MAG: M23 family metallopeptidase [Pseudobdellovibrionaceae bacterium]